MHAVSPEQFAAAEQRHEQEKVVAKQVKEKGVVKDTEALRVSMDQLREVIYASSREVEDLRYTLQLTRTKESSELKYVAFVATFFLIVVTSLSQIMCRYKLSLVMSFTATSRVGKPSGSCRRANIEGLACRQ